MAHLYIHIPFCLSKCSYCSFCSYPGKNYLFDRYTRAVMEEVKIISSGVCADPLQTIFFGGGTPSLLSLENITDILSACKNCFKIDTNAEISMEVNPRSVDFVKLLSLSKIGINRLSIGVQSFLDKELFLLGRIHNAQEAWETVEWARKSGYRNINIDLISGVPGQTADMWRWNLQTALELEPEHLSLYQLTVEEGTSMKDQIDRERLALPAEDEILAMDRISGELCVTSGFTQYEISNYSIPGFSCQHNINYWKNKEYYAVGAGAVRYLAGVRMKNVEDPERYCAMITENGSAVVESEKLDKEASFRETVVMGLRMVAGISLEDLYRRYGIDLRKYYGKVLENLLEMSLLELHSSNLRLTARGREIANRVMADLV
jgi:putative oxygen-independent coproporphyrinogen III oxidase